MNADLGDSTNTMRIKYDVPKFDKIRNDSRLESWSTWQCADVNKAFNLSPRDLFKGSWRRYGRCAVR